MPILILYDGKEIPLTLEKGESAALYAVPQAYSEDGLFLSVWGANELEPVPACTAGGALPLLRLDAVEENGALTVRETLKAEGVSYA